MSIELQKVQKEIWLNSLIQANFLPNLKWKQVKGESRKKRIVYSFLIPFMKTDLLMDGFWFLNACFFTLPFIVEGKAGDLLRVLNVKAKPFTSIATVGQEFCITILVWNWTVAATVKQGTWVYLQAATIYIFESHKNIYNHSLYYIYQGLKIFI